MTTQTGKAATTEGAVKTETAAEKAARFGADKLGWLAALRCSHWTVAPRSWRDDQSTVYCLPCRRPEVVDHWLDLDHRCEENFPW